MVRKASRRPGQGPTTSTTAAAAAAAGVGTPSASSSPRSNAPSGGQRRGVRANEMQSTTRRTSMLYQVYDSAAVGGANALTSAPSPSHAAALVAAAAVLANPNGQVSPPPTSNRAAAGAGGGGSSSPASAPRPRKTGGSPAVGSSPFPVPPSSSPSGTSRARLLHTTSDDTALPRPVATGGSYANENPRLIVSEPLKSTTTTTSTTVSAATATAAAANGVGSGAVPNSAAFRTRVSNQLQGAPTPRSAQRNASSRNLPRDASQLSSESGGSSTRSGTSAGETRPRALSLPRARESVVTAGAEVLPRLRPVRGGDALTACAKGDAGGGGGGGGGVASSRSGQGEAESGELREVLSAPPAAFSELTKSTSPRLQPRRTRDRGGGGGGDDGGEATTTANGGRTRDAPTGWVAAQEGNNGGGGGGGSSSSGSNAANGTVGRGRQGNGNTPRSTNGRTTAVPSSTATRQLKAAPAVAVNDDDDDNWGDPESNSEDTPRHLFSSTQLLSSLRPNPVGEAAAGTLAGGGTVQQPRQPAGPPGAARPHPSPPAAGTECSPSYKFNVVLSSGKSATVPISLVAGSGCVQGMRPTMEDAHFTELNATHVRGQPVSLMAVLDGHCGRRVADLGAKWLPHYVLHHAALGENNALALVEAILQTDREIFHTLQAKKAEAEQQRKAGRSTGRRRRDVYEEMMEENTGANGGSTLITAAVCGRMLYVACLGDARAVLYDGQTTIAMSEDHKPDNAEEARRIARCGGFVQFGRVCGILAVSRALGDFEFKFQPSSNPEEEGLLTDFPFGAQREGGVGGGGGESAGSTNATTSAPSSSPSSQANRRFISNRDLMVSNVADVRQLHLTDASAFLLLACDGLWDVLSNEEATEFVRDFLSYTPDVCDPRILSGEKPRPGPDVLRRVLNNCCQKLSEFAVDRGSMDNVSAMVLFFHDVVDTVARFNGRLPPSAREPSSANESSVMSGTSSRGSRVRPGRASLRPSPSSSSFELTNNQVKVRNGRVVARR